MSFAVAAHLAAADAPVRLELDGSVAAVTLNRPEAQNVLDVATSHALMAAIVELERLVRAGHARAVLVRANGRSFCAGGDIEAFEGGVEARTRVLDTMIPPLNDAIRTLSRLPVPVISALNGAVGGGGIGLAFCADIALAAESMVLRGGYTAIGLSPDIGSSWFVTRIVGTAIAKRIFFCNEKIPAAQCLAWGLVSEVVPDAELRERARAIAQTLAAGATHAIARTKELIDGAPTLPLAEHLQREHRAMVESGTDAESTEGVAAFLERRAPRFI